MEDIATKAAAPTPTFSATHNVECPLCHSAPGKFCRSRGRGRVVLFHEARWAAAKAAR